MTVEVTLTFVPYPQGGQSYTTPPKTISVGIQPPDGIEPGKDPNPFDVNVDVVGPGQAPNWPVKFYVQGHGRTLYFQGTVYEQITRNPYPNSQLKFKDQAMDTAAYLNFTGPGEITDVKAIFNAGGYDTLQNSPPPLDEFTQTIALDIPYGCGGFVNGGKLPIANFHMRMNKVNATQWQLELVP